MTGRTPKYLTCPRDNCGYPLSETTIIGEPPLFHCLKCGYQRVGR